MKRCASPASTRCAWPASSMTSRPRSAASPSARASSSKPARATSPCSRPRKCTASGCRARSSPRHARRWRRGRRSSMTKSLLSVLLILLGTGYPRPDAEHAGASTAIVAGDRWYVVDAGRGATLRIAATELKYDRMRAVFLTHLHSDHTAGLPDLFNTSWQFGRKTTTLQLYGPDGTKRLADAMLEFFHDDIHIRRDLQEKHPAGGATIATHIVREGVVLDAGVCRVTAFAVDHRPVVPAFGYRFDCGGKSIGVSGDTRP